MLYFERVFLHCAMLFDAIFFWPLNGSDYYFKYVFESLYVLAVLAPSRSPVVSIK